MITSPEIGNIAKALAAAQAELVNPTKNKTATIPRKDGGPGFKYTYADFATALDEIRPVMARHKIAIAQAPSFESGFIILHTRLLHESGEWIGNIYPVGSMADHRTMGSALSYARRYALFPLIGVQGEDDDDGEADAQTPRPRAPVVESIADSAIRRMSEAETQPIFEAEVAKARALFPRLSPADKERLMDAVEARRGYWFGMGEKADGA